MVPRVRHHQDTNSSCKEALTWVGQISRVRALPARIARDMRSRLAAKLGMRDPIKYDRTHPEIFNDREQARLRSALTYAVSEVRSGGSDALDFGAGTGNVTSHLQALGLVVTAADVTPKFLDVVSSRYGVRTIELQHVGMQDVPDEAFDFIALYSVLHHIPDYLSAARALVAKLKPGGVICIEHELNHGHYFPSSNLQAFRSENYEATRCGRWDPAHKRWQDVVVDVTSPSRQRARVRRWLGPSYEGDFDIHVYPDDHIDWDRLAGALAEKGAEIVRRADYLLYRQEYDVETWERWKDRCYDMSSLVARRIW